MSDLAAELLRMIVRAFYHTEHILVLDALCFHSTLSDHDLGLVVGMNVKPVRKIAGRLKEDGLLSVQTRMERRTDGSGGFYGAGHGQSGKERLTSRDWYYINYHKAIDAVKYRLWKLNKHVEDKGAPATERKELVCPRCKSEWTIMQAMDNVDPQTGEFKCHKCDHDLDRVPDEDRSENEHMKRLNSQVEPFLSLMRRIDGTTVPENDFEAALAKHVPVKRDDDLNPAPRTEVIDAPSRNVQDTKGLEMKPEKIAVQLQDDETVKKESEQEELRRRQEKEARQNALPEWISKSTITGDITTVGMREEARRRERDAHTGGIAKDGEAEEKKSINTSEEDVMKEYWAELELEKQRAAQARQDDDDEDEDEDEFEDVDPTGTSTPLRSFATSTGINTPNVESSNATDDERDSKRLRLDPTGESSMHPVAGPSSNGNQAAELSDEDDDDLEFENV